MIPPRLVTQFLLNELPESEREKLQDRIVEEEGFAEALELAERELLDAYARNELPAAVRARVESELLFNERQFDKLLVAKALVPARGKSNIPLVIIGGLAAALVLVVPAYIFLEDAPFHNKELAVESHAAKPPQAKPRVVATALLVPGVVRGGEQQMLRLPSSSGLVRFDFQWTVPTVSASYSMTLLGPDGKEAWRQQNVKPQSNGFSITVPTEVFRKGQFHAVLDTEPAANYYFTVR
jgi:hypothetical protein